MEIREKERERERVLVVGVVVIDAVAVGVLHHVNHTGLFLRTYKHCHRLVYYLLMSQTILKSD